MPIDLDRVRADTPGCANVTHLNNAGASLMPAPVLDAFVEHARLEAAIGGYEAADAREDAWEHTYDAIAALLGCRREEVAVVENATRGWDMAFYGIPFERGDRILTAVAEYGSNYLAYLQVAERTGARVEVIPNDEAGELSVAALEAMMDDDVALVSVTHVPTNGGLVNPVEEVGRVVAQSRALYLVDAVQAVGQFPVDVDRIGCDLLAATGRKFLRGPRGTGFLYARADTTGHLEPPFVDVLAAHWDDERSYTMRSDARRFENWETNYSAKIALGVAVDYALDLGLEAIAEANRRLAARLRDRLRAIDGVTVLDLGREPCAIVSFAVAGVPAGDVKASLAERRINVSVATVEDTLLDMRQRGYEEWVRASPHYFNSADEVDALADAVAARAAG